MRDQRLPVGGGGIHRRAQEGVPFEPLVGDEPQQSQRALAEKRPVCAP